MNKIMDTNYDIIKVVAKEFGAVAATSAYNDKKIHGELCQVHWRPASAVDRKTQIIN